MKRVAHCTLLVFTSVTGVEVIEVHVCMLQGFAESFMNLSEKQSTDIQGVSAVGSLCTVMLAADWREVYCILW